MRTKRLHKFFYLRSLLIEFFTLLMGCARAWLDATDASKKKKQKQPIKCSL